MKKIFMILLALTLVCSSVFAVTLISPDMSFSYGYLNYNSGVHSYSDELLSFKDGFTFSSDLNKSNKLYAGFNVDYTVDPWDEGELNFSAFLNTFRFFMRYERLLSSDDEYLASEVSVDFAEDMRIFDTVFEYYRTGKKFNTFFTSDTSAMFADSFESSLAMAQTVVEIYAQNNENGIISMLSVETGSDNFANHGDLALDYLVHYPVVLPFASKSSKFSFDHATTFKIGAYTILKEDFEDDLNITFSFNFNSSLFTAHTDKTSFELSVSYSASSELNNEVTAVDFFDGFYDGRLGIETDLDILALASNAELSFWTLFTVQFDFTDYYSFTVGASIKPPVNHHGALVKFAKESNH